MLNGYSQNLSGIGSKGYETTRPLVRLGLLVFVIAATCGGSNCVAGVVSGMVGSAPAVILPVANPGGPYAGVLGAGITFNGSNSTAPSGHSLTYSWSFGDGSTGTGATPTHAYSKTGSFTVSLTVTDVVGGGINTKTVATTISPAPTANAGGPYAGAAGLAITFNGKKSVGLTAISLTYKWMFGDGTTGTGVTPTHSYSQAGSYAVSLQVSETVGGTVVSATSTATATITSPLVITASAAPKPNAAGWNNTPVTITFTCTDSVSPVTNCPPPQVVFTAGANQVVSATAQDQAGNTGSASATVNVDLTSPVLSIVSPLDGATIALSSPSVGLSGTVSDDISGLASVTCNGAGAVISSSTFTCAASLVPGPNSVSVLATDAAGNITTAVRALTYAAAPQVSIISPVNLSVTNLSPVTVNGTVSDPVATLVLNGIAVPQSSGSFSIPVPLVEGLNVLSAVATSTGGISSTATVQITLDTTPPHLTIDSPSSGTTTTAASVTVSGLANDVVVGTVNSGDVQVSVNGIPAQVSNRNYSVPSVPLAMGPNMIQVTGHDRAGNGTTISATVTRVLASQPPPAAIGNTVVTQWLNVISGNNQSAVVGTQLPAQLVVSLTNPSSQPVPNQTVTFKVVGDNGLVSNNGSTPASAVAVTTDGNGHARVQWSLGQRAGAGNDMVQVSSALAVSPVTFIATGLTGSPAQVIVDSGNNQTGVVGQALTFPFVADVVDAGHNRVANVPVTFTVKSGGGTLSGSPTQVVNTDSNGRAIAVLTLGIQSGYSNNVVEASYSGNAGMPAAFAATAQTPGDPANTTVSGVVLDNSNNPIEGATVRLYQIDQGNVNNLPAQIGPAVQSDVKGAFLIARAPVGAFKLMVDGATATGTDTFPPLEYDIVTVAGINNTVGMPIYLPALDQVNKVCVSETTGGTLTLPKFPGFSLTIAPGSATFPGGSRTGCVSVTPVNGDKIPMTPGFGQQPRFIVTIQPVGTTFNPPAPITLPNVDGLKPKEVTEMYSYDHDLSMFVAIGTGTVSNDGSVIASNPGVGVLKAGWHCGGDPDTKGSAGTCPSCQSCQGSGCTADSAKNGNSCTASGDPGICSNGGCIRPTVQITGANLRVDAINVTLGPDMLPGTLALQLIGSPNNFTVPTLNAKPGSQSFSFQPTTIPRGEYTSIMATWTVNGVSVSATLAYHFKADGVVRHSVYNTPYESQCTGAATTSVYITNSACKFTSGTLSTQFINQVNINGSGVSTSYGALQIEAFCLNHGSNVPPDAAGKSYRAVTSIVPACGGALSNVTVASYRASQGDGPLDCGASVFIFGLNTNGGIGTSKSVTDNCPACEPADPNYVDHLDNYTTRQACSARSFVDLGNFSTFEILQ